MNSERKARFGRGREDEQRARGHNKGRGTRKIVLLEGNKGEQESKEREKVSSEGEQERKKCSFLMSQECFYCVRERTRELKKRKLEMIKCDYLSVYLPFHRVRF